MCATRRPVSSSSFRDNGKALTACLVLGLGRRDAYGVTLRMEMSLSLLDLLNIESMRSHLPRLGGSIMS